ncbi:DNA alkylation repair protein [Riemerella columbina]|uniref:DNA alkylation repair protein n=1 Tax=Riemerella columbina TaxID=103810 RepID=UPI0026702CB3|nr:DNA alkylation repair protein [Riemerella columbina]WKS95416.1 DNA alkylation repair protein [Riemerella columbina]
MGLNEDIIQALNDLAQPEKAAFFPRFFKTGKGEYAEGDQFIGVTVPDQRQVAKAYGKAISLPELKALLYAPIHEYRLTALLMLVQKYEKTKNPEEKAELVQFYLDNLEPVNNWDLVDSTAYKILGRHCFETQNPSSIEALAGIDHLWRQRIAVVATLHYIKKQSFDLPLRIILKNLQHSHDLMQKANGWMLREIGKKDEKTLVQFLEKHHQQMPRTTLRYAIEKLDELLRQTFLKKPTYGTDRI